MPRVLAPHPRPSVTVRDVANRSGVSIGTVSRALKNQPGLTEETRKLVLRAALELGYDTTNLRPSKLRRVSFLTSRLADLPVNPFYSPVLHGVESACRDEEIVLSYTSLRPGDRAADVVRRHEADGLICTGYFEPRLLERIAGIGLPIVLIDHFAKGFAAVNMDNIVGARDATQHLLSIGRRRIAFIGGPAHHSILQRQRGFRQALFDAGIPADPELEVNCEFLPGSAYQTMKRLLALKNPPTGVFTFNDLTALEAMRACQEAGLRIPDDISFVGFDDIDTASHSNPPLSTIRVDKELLGRRGLDLLLDRERSADAEWIVPVDLMIRQSSRPPVRPIPARQQSKAPSR